MCLKKKEKAVKLSNSKYKGITYVNSKGKKEMYIEQNGQYFKIDENGATKRLDAQMQNKIKILGGLEKAFKNVTTSKIDDKTIDDLKNKYKNRKKDDYELGNVFHEHNWASGKKKSIYRPPRHI